MILIVKFLGRQNKKGDHGFFIRIAPYHDMCVSFKKGADLTQ